MLLDTGTKFVTKDAITDVNQVGHNGQYKVLGNIILDERKHYLIRDDDGENHNTYIMPFEEIDQYSVKVISKY